MCVVGKGIRKLTHYAWSYKSMLLLSLTMYCDMEDLLESLTLRDAEKRVDPEHHVKNWEIFGEYGCERKGTKMLVCADDLGNHSPWFWVLLFLVIFETCYGFCIFSYSLYNAPKYGSIRYYAHSIQSRQQKYFRTFMRTLYAIILAQFVIYICAVIFWDLKASSDPDSVVEELSHWENIPWRFMRNLMCSMLICRMAVSQLDDTGKANFEYDPKNQKANTKIVLSPPSILIDDLTVFDMLEEAVMIYSLNGNDHFIKKILKDPSQRNIDGVMEFYGCAFKNALRKSKSIKPIQEKC